MTERERWRRNVELAGCDSIPCSISFSPAVWNQYRDRLEGIVRRFPSIFGEYRGRDKPWDEFGPAYREGEEYTDAWGCVWYNTYGGIEGQVIRHPLEDYAALDRYQPPDPLVQAERGPRGNWDEIKRNMEEARAAGKVVSGHGDRFYERVHFLRGYENFMLDIAEGRNELLRLIDMVLEHNMKLVKKWLEIGVDVMAFGDDLGMQDRLQISPEAWRKYFKPGYAEMFGVCRQVGAHVSFHSDGYIVDIMPDLIEIGVTILNPQDLCNGLDNIERELKGKICIALDIDRQKIVPFGTPEQIDAHILNCIRTLGSPQGGLTLVCGIYPGTPLENIEALCTAMEKYRTYWADK